MEISHFSPRRWVLAGCNASNGNLVGQCTKKCGVD